ncbi:hypothetical protein Scep_012358 [Stephania cephalantha]|uniref:Uncharacterized protein n=1 Tax=Stephania cephalantha TaxID=152367 RepID=A0AAP0JFU6_9MAGN
MRSLPSAVSVLTSPSFESQFSFSIDLSGEEKMSAIGCFVYRALTWRRLIGWTGCDDALVLVRACHVAGKRRSESRAESAKFWEPRRERERKLEREREVAGEEGDPAAARSTRLCSGHAEAAGGEQWRRSRRVAVVVDAAGEAAAGSRHGAESVASTAQTADGGQRRERAVAGSDLAAAAADQQCRRASSDAAGEQCGRTSDAGGARQRLDGQQTRERLRRRCDATPARDERPTSGDATAMMR